jgi:hypothetical protein
MTSRIAALRSSITQEGILPRSTRLALNAGLVLAWAWLFRSVFDYIGMLFTHDDFRTNQIRSLAC